MWFFKRLSNILALTSSLGLLSASAKTLPSILSLSLTVVCVCAYTPMCTVWYRGRGECCSVTLSYSLVT